MPPLKTPGALVRAAEAHGVPLSQVPVAVASAIDARLDDQLAAVFQLERSVAARRVSGATAPEAVQQQLAAARAALALP